GVKALHPLRASELNPPSKHTVAHFFTEMKQYKIEKSKLEKGLKVRFPDARSWWDVGKLFPIMFMDRDKQHVAAFYPDGTPMERYVPDNWTSEFCDFASDSSEDDFPFSERFWIQDGVDMLAILNERGKELTDET
ncbi:MAG: hypothetical protein ACKVH8_01945, partial [Pirellulales bacterium]